MPALLVRVNDTSDSALYIDLKTVRLVEAYGRRSRINRFPLGRRHLSKHQFSDSWLRATKGGQVAVTCFMGTQSNPRQQIALSHGGGTRFTKPIVLNTGQAFGYTSMALKQDGAKAQVRQVSSQGVAGTVAEVAKGGFWQPGDSLIASGSAKHIETASLGVKQRALLRSLFGLRGRNHVAFLLRRFVVADEAAITKDSGPDD